MRSNTGEHKPFSDYYTDQTARLVADFFAYDIEAFGYRFEDENAG